MFEKAAKALTCVASSTIQFFSYILISFTNKNIATEFCLLCPESREKGM